MKFGLYLLIMIIGAGLATPGYADALQQLEKFIQHTQSARAQFSQQVFDDQGEPLREAAGEMLFQRPGRFRWVYHQPYEQIIVGDGQRFWLYDVDLEQVTVKQLDEALGSSPAALLAGEDDIQQAFKLSDAGEQQGLSWLQAVPRSEDGSFEQIRMGFDQQGTLQVMELYDTFGHRTVLRFTGMQSNPEFSGQPFNFVPPEHVDVLRDE